MTLDEIKSQFTGLMNRRDLTANTALVSTFVNQSIMRIQRDLRIPAMEKSVNVTIGNPYTGLIIPSDLLELISIIPTTSDGGSIRLRRGTLERCLNLATFVGDPAIYARQGGLWVLGPAPALNQVIRIDYYAEMTPLVNGTDTNIIAEIAWDLIVYGALSAACEYYKDSRRGSTVDPNTGKIIDGFEGSYNRIFDALQNQADFDEIDGTNAVQPVLFYPDDDTDNSQIWVP